jgi:putative phage-type endonuclease
MPLIEVDQGSKEWLEMRSGCVTASRVADVITKLKKGGYSAARNLYLFDVVIGRLTGLNPESYVSPAMEWGMANEDLAKAAYEMKTDRTVEPIGFALHDRINFFGASPDGLVGKDGLIECKCPNTSTHLGYLMAGVVPEDYQPQMLAEMACTGRKWVDFVSYDPRLPKKLQLFVRRFERNDERIAEMEREVELFLGEVANMLERLAQDDPSELTPVLVKSLDRCTGEAASK